MICRVFPIRLLPLLLAVCAAVAQAEIGVVHFSLGDVRVLNSAGASRPGVKGTQVNEGESVVVGVTSSAQLKMIDGGLLALRPETQMKFDEYKWSGREDGSERGLMSLVRGGFRTITGAIGRLNKSSYRVTTPTATVGIRGTDHEIVHIVVPVGPAIASAPAAGTYDKVNVGSATITAQGVTVVVQPNQVGYAPPAAAPRILPQVPNFLRATPPPRAAAQPAQQQAQQGEAAGQAAAPAQEQAAPLRESSVVDSPAQVAASSSTAVQAADTTSIGVTTVVAVSPTTTTETTTSTTTTSTSTTATVPVLLESSTGSLNLTEQTVTTSSGQTAAISSSVVTTLPAAPAWSDSTTAIARGQPFVNGTASTAGGFEDVFVFSRTPGHSVSFGFDSASSGLKLLSSTDVAALGLSGAQSSVPTGSISSPVSTTYSFQDGTVTISGGSLGAEGYYVAADNTAYMGRWAGGQIEIGSGLATVPLGTGGVVWGLALEPELPGISRASSVLSGMANAYVHHPQQLVGTLAFTKAYATAAFDGSGNTGSLTSASLAADFRKQTVDASVGLSFSGARTSTFSASLTEMPISGSRFHGSVSPGSTNSTCTGTCDASGYYTYLEGGFGGTTGISGALFNYKFISDSSSTPFTDTINGGVAFTASGSATAGQNLSFPSSTSLRHLVFYPVPATDGNLYSASINNGSGVASPNANYLFDAGGSLARIQDTPYTLFDQGTAVTPFTVPVSSSTNNSGTPVMMSFYGGTAAETYDATSLIGARFGRYQGGYVAVNDLLYDIAYTDPLGSASALWAVHRHVPSANLVPGGALTGQWQYNRISNAGTPGYATTPTDQHGNLGTLLGARLAVDFNTMTVNPSVRLSMAQTGAGGAGGAVTLSAYAEDVAIPLGSSSFNVDNSDTNPLRVSCLGVGCTPTYGGRIVGNFTSLAANGSTADGAMLRYSFRNSSPELISGLVALQQGSLLLPPTTLNRHVVTSHFYWVSPPSRTFGTGDQFRTNNFDDIESTPVFAGPNGNFSSVSGDDDTVTISGNTAGASTVTTLASGISFGRYDSGSTASNTTGSPLLLTGKDFNGSFSNREVLGAYHWIAGPQMWPIFASSVMAGTATYSVADHSLPTDQNLMSGTFNTASLFVNFNRQYVNTSLNVTMPANTFNGGTSPRVWSASANQVRLDDGGGFFASGSGFPYAHNPLTANLNGGTAFGNLQGQLSGTMMDGATLSYTLGASDPLNGSKHEHVNGVIAFGSPTFSGAGTLNVLEPYILKLTARGSVAGFNASTGTLNSGSSVAAAIDEEYLTRIGISALDPQRTKFNANGELTEFDAQSVSVSVSGTCPTTCFVNELPSRISINAAGSTASGALPTMPSISSAATVVESGIDATTGIRWGRYSNDQFAVVDRITGLPVGSGNFALGPVNHYLLSPVQSGPTVLPTTGTFTYTLVGNTSPTDTSGAVGVLNSASLVANFGAAVPNVDVSVGATVAGRTWNASATNVKILAGVGFEASKSISGSGDLAVTCSGTGCGATTAGRIMGGFTGPTGKGAGIAYTLNTGAGPSLINNLPANGGVTMGGVAAFRR